MKISIPIVASLFALALVASCKPSGRGFQMEIIEKTETFRIGDSSMELDYRFEYLAHPADGVVMRNIRIAQVADFFGPKFVRTSPAASAKAFDEAVFSDFENADADYPWDGYLSILSSSDVVGDRVLAYTVERSEYSGGAHGLETTMYSNYDLRTGARLTLDDLFTPEGKAALPGAIRSAIMKENGVATWEELAAKSCYWDEGEVSATENFLLSATHITFMYNPYEIGCYAQGPTKVGLILNDIVGFKTEMLQK